MCTGDAKWKREVYPEHKFDFIDTRDFRDNGALMHLKYFWLYLLVLKSFLVYISDIFSVTIMLTTQNWSNETYIKCQHENGCFFIPFNVGKWLFVGCIIFSFLLLAYESRKAKKIIASRDISYAFTNVTANNYFCLRSYDHFCFFDQISNSTKKKDDFAFFIFFTFKSWKRLLLADAPRQVINALTLYSIYLAHVNDGPWYKLGKYFSSSTSLSTSVLTVTTFFTVTIFAGSAVLLFIAAICYIPLLCYIQGNLKEYICHKVDKRIDKFIKNRNKVRHAKAVQIANAEAKGDFSHLKNKKGELLAARLPQPTLPNLSVDDDDDDITLRKPAASIYSASDTNTYGVDTKSDYPVDYPPPMPKLNYGYHTNPSATSMHTDEDTYYEKGKVYDADFESTANLALSAAPFGMSQEGPGPTRYTASPAPYYSSTMKGSAPYTHEAQEVQAHHHQYGHREQEDDPYGGHDDPYGGHEDVYDDLYAAHTEGTVRQTGHSRNPSQATHPTSQSVHRRHASRQESDPHLLTMPYTHQRDDSYQYEMQAPAGQAHSWRGPADDYGRGMGGGYAL